MATKMKISELIKKLASFQEKYGDIDVVRYGENEDGIMNHEPVNAIWHGSHKSQTGIYEEIAIIV